MSNRVVYSTGMVTAHTTHQLRGYCTKAGYAQLDAVLRDCARLYNAGLQEWRDAYTVHAGYVHAVDLDTGKRKMSKDGSGYLFHPLRVRREEGNPPVNLYSQYRELTAIRKADPDGWGSLDIGISRGVLKRLDLARNAFYRRVKAGEKPGYPRFKAFHRWKCIDMARVAPGMVKGNKVIVKGMPVIRVKPNRPLPSSGALKSLMLVRRGRRLDVNLTYEVEKEPLPSTPSSVGIDMGISDRMMLSSGQIMVAGGDIPAAGLLPAEIPASGAPIAPIVAEGVSPGVVESPCSNRSLRWRCRVSPGVVESPTSSMPRRTIDRETLAKMQRRLSRCQKGSGEWKRRSSILSNFQGRERVRNRNECHRMTTAIVREYGHIAVEKLSIGNMTRSAAGTVEEPGTNVNAKSGLNRESLTQTWGLMRQQLAYKAIWAGRRYVEVDPRYTSQTCNSCGMIDRENRKGKVFRCVACGFTLDADVNAARNILRKSLAGGNSPPLSIEAT